MQTHATQIRLVLARNHSLWRDLVFSHFAQAPQHGGSVPRPPSWLCDRNCSFIFENRQRQFNRTSEFSK